MGADSDGGQAKGGASPKSGGETDGNGAGKPTKGASSQTARKVSCALCSRIPSFDEVHNEALKANKFCDQQLATTAA